MDEGRPGTHPTKVGSWRGLVGDVGASLRQGAASARGTFTERRRLRGESPRFKQAFAASRHITGWLSRAESEALFELAAAVPSGLAIVEIGSYLGKSTAFLALGASNAAALYAVDPHTGDRSQVDAGLEGIDTSKQFLRNMESIGVTDKVRPRVMTSLEAAAEWDDDRDGAVGLLFVDGWHSTEAVVEDGSAWAPHLAEHALVAFDDVNHPEVAAGIARLVAAGAVRPLAGRVGKVGFCGPRSQWPGRLRRIASK